MELILGGAGDEGGELGRMEPLLGSILQKVSFTYSAFYIIVWMGSKLVKHILRPGACHSVSHIKTAYYLVHSHQFMYDTRVTVLLLMSGNRSEVHETNTHYVCATGICPFLGNAIVPVWTTCECGLSKLSYFISVISSGWISAERIQQRIQCAVISVDESLKCEISNFDCCSLRSLVSRRRYIDILISNSKLIGSGRCRS